MGSKTLYHTVHVNREDFCGDAPEAIQVTITAAQADEIRRYAQFVKENRLCKVETFDSSAMWLVEMPLEDAGDNQVTESDIQLTAETLNVDETDFWYKAYIKNSGVEIESGHIRISALENNKNSTGDKPLYYQEYVIPCGWSMTGKHYIKASSRKEAEAIAKNGPLPTDGQYLDGSFEILDNDE